MINLCIVGRTSPAMQSSLTEKYRVRIKYNLNSPDDFSANGTGPSIIKNGDYSSLLIDGSLSSKFIDNVLQAAKDKADVDVMILTEDSNAYMTFKTTPPTTHVDRLAALMGFERQGKPALIVMVTNAKGGVGKSSLATNLATILGQHEEVGKGLKVALLEDDWTTRSIRQLMGVDKNTSKTASNLVADIQRNGGVVTPEMLSEYMLPSYGVDCLIGSHTPIIRNHIEDHVSLQIMNVLGHDLGYNIILVDAPPDPMFTGSHSTNVMTKLELLPTFPLLIVPVVPETTILRSANETFEVATHYRHHPDHVWPVINCIKPSHDPEFITPKTLWAKPKGVIPFSPDAQYVGDSERPLVVEPVGGLLARGYKKFVGFADIYHIRQAYSHLADQIIAYMEENVEK